MYSQKVSHICVFERWAGLRFFDIFRKRKGFTLIELLVVIGIMGVLAGMIAIALGGGREQARIARAKSEVADIQRAIIRLEIDTEEWPDHQIPWQVNTGGSNEVWDLNAEEAGLTQDDSGTPFTGWKGPYLDSVPSDPWGNPYFLDTDYSVKANGDPCDGAGGCSNAAAIGSFGPDGSGQNVYNADDVIFILAR